MIKIQISGLTGWQKFLATFLGILLLGIVLTFSIILIPILAMAGLGLFAYVKWKLAKLSKTMNRQAEYARPNPNEENSTVIEGEAVVVHKEEVLK